MTIATPTAAVALAGAATSSAEASSGLTYYGLPPYRHEGALYGSLNDRGRSITLAP